MSDNDGRDCTTFIWTIENFGISKWRCGITSPVFSSNLLENTDWKITIEPDDDNFLIYLGCISKDIEGSIVVDYELSFVDVDCIPLESTDIMNEEFVNDDQWCRVRLGEIKVVLGSKKSEYLAQNTLTVRCRMWKEQEEGSQAQTELLFGYSWIEINSFIWTIQDYCRLEPKEKRNVHLVDIDLKTPILTFEFFTDEGHCLTITQVNCKEVEASCKVSILDATGKEFRSDYNSDCFLYSPICPLFLLPPRDHLDVEESLYLPMGKLTLRVEYLISFSKTAMESENIQQISNRKFQVKEDLTSCVKAPSEYTPTEEWVSEVLGDGESIGTLEDTEPSDYSSQPFFDEMQRLFSEGLFSDVTLHAGGTVFRAHKNILSARSAYFKAMFTDQHFKGLMLADCFDVADVDADTLHNMLCYVYSGKVEEDMEWKDAMRLYFAADKFMMEDLKQMSGFVLRSGFSSSNACKILVQADLHEDKDLRSTALEFIVNHDDEIIGMEEWKSFQKNNIQLAVEILSELYMRKIRNIN